MNRIYCVYFTHYNGYKLPPFYIGSSYLERVKDGYHGSVSSDKFESVWKQELKDNPHLFKTDIIEICDTREEAFDKELELQRKLNVVKSEYFTNMCYAKANFGDGNLWVGRKHSEGAKAKMSKTTSEMQLGKKRGNYKCKGIPHNKFIISFDGVFESCNGLEELYQMSIDKGFAKKTLYNIYYNKRGPLYDKGWRVTKDAI